MIRITAIKIETYYGHIDVIINTNKHKDGNQDLVAGI